MRIFLQGLIVLAVVCFFPGPAQAEPEIEVNLKPSRTAKVGEICQLILQISWRSEEANYSFTHPEPVLENFSVEEIGESNEVFQKKGEEWKKKTFRTDLKALKSGKGRIRPFVVTYIDPARQVGGHFEIPEKEIKIAPDRSRLYQGVVLTAALFSAGGLIGGWIVSGKRKRKSEEAALGPEQTLEERLVTDLTRRKEEGEGSDYLLEAGKLFRGYLGEKYSVPGEKATRHELIAQIEGKISAEELRTLKRIFDRLDEWRYADRGKSQENEHYLYDEMIRFIEGKKIAVR